MRGNLFIAAAVLAALGPGVARAAERVTLRNGFEMRCDHHAEVEGRVRLYLSAGEDNYIEFAPEEIAGVEQVPDPPPAEPAADATAPARPQRASAQRTARLSPADLGEMLAKAGQEHNLDVDLLASLVKAESGGNARAVSRAGARGLMQLMPATAPGWAWKTASSRTRTCAAARLIWMPCSPATTTTWRWHWLPTTRARRRWTGTTAFRPTAKPRAYVARVIHEFNRRVLAREAQAAVTRNTASR